MRLVTYANGDQIGVGVESENDVHFTGYTEMADLIRDGALGLERAATAAASGRPVAYDRLLAPVTNPGKIFGSGVNYYSHGDEEPGFVFPDEPTLDFIKLSSALIGPTDDIVIPAHDGVIKRPDGFHVDYEVEFGVVFGKRAKNVSREDALDYVFGYTLFNDVGARAVQFKNKQADLGKGFDTFSPMGPRVVTRDEMPDLEAARIQCLVNGELRQDATVGEMINPIPVLIEWITSIITCEPGDCISTGTPAGCGTFMQPPSYLQPGDEVVCREETIGELRNRVVAG
ncbi:MAG: fumarylacetoacetate hydrolase family protein [Actinobacteria bacterium]|nr:fumarylacetoacetate hydrolase family protein [Actinomycetota bacterium]